MASMWDWELKENQTKHTRINGCYYEQVYRLHYENVLVHFPVMKNVSIWEVMVMLIIVKWMGKMGNIKSKFLKVNIDLETKSIYLPVLQGFENYYAHNKVLELHKCQFVGKNRTRWLSDKSY